MGLPMQHAHEDGEHSGHCSDPSCLMYWAFHRVGAVDRLRSRLESDDMQLPRLDTDCLEDLATLRTAP